MKRKVIQIAESTQLISLPRKWCLANSIRKGDELNVEYQADKLTVSCKPESKIEKAEIRMKEFGELTELAIYALYKKGVDEIKIYFEKPEDVQIVQNALHSTTVGYELVEQDSKGCLIKNISGNIMGFDSMMRRIFLLLISQAEESAKILSEKNLADTKNLFALEESNNRLTTLCRRYINKYGAPGNHKVGPYYRILEEIEKISDDYKGISTLSNIKKDQVKINPNIIGAYTILTQFLRDFYESFYKFNAQKVLNITNTRKELIAKWIEELKNARNPVEIILMHNALSILRRISSITATLLILEMPTLNNEEVHKEH